MEALSRAVPPACPHPGRATRGADAGVPAGCPVLSRSGRKVPLNRARHAPRKVWTGSSPACSTALGIRSKNAPFEPIPYPLPAQGPRTALVLVSVSFQPVTRRCRSQPCSVTAQATTADAAPAERDAAARSGAPLKVIISGAPASGKGTQCELIVQKFGLVHISAGDLLRAEVASGSPNGAVLKEYMDAGKLVPDDIVISIIKSRLEQADVAERGWLLDGYPRSATQAHALIQAGVVPEVFILLEVPDDVIIERVAGRRMDPESGKIYHLTFSPPPNDPALLARLTQRSDDTEERVKARLDTHAQNVSDVLGLYSDKLLRVDGNRAKDMIFAEIEAVLASLHGRASAPALQGPEPGWRGMPTRLNDIPHTREIRHYFYRDVCWAATNAVADGLSRVQLDLLIPELNPEMDVYRIGTLLELIRELAFTFARQGKRVKVCVQGAMGSGIFTGMPLQLSGTRRMLESMDWGEEEEEGVSRGGSRDTGLAELVSVGAVGSKDVGTEDEVFILMAPQNAVGNCILEDLEAMAKAAGTRPLIIVNPRLKDLPGASGVMQVSGRAERLAFQGSFERCYVLRLLFLAGTLYPILGAVRRAYPGPYEVYKRTDVAFGEESYTLAHTFLTPPTSADISAAFSGKLRGGKADAVDAEPKGFFAFLSRFLL